MIESPRPPRRACLPATAALAGALVLALATLPSRAADVGVSISIGQPGYYGQINIGDVPQPPVVIYNAPVVIERDPHYAGPRCICASRRDTRSIGPSTAVNTAPAAGRSTSCATTGTGVRTSRTINNDITKRCEESTKAMAIRTKGMATDTTTTTNTTITNDASRPRFGARTAEGVAPTASTLICLPG